MKNNYKITKHAIERYSERINYSQKSVIQAMLKDLRSFNKRIVNVGKKKYVFGKNYKEFVIEKNNKGIEVVITVIKHDRDEKGKAIEKRMREREEYLSIMKELTNEDIDKRK